MTPLLVLYLRILSSICPAKLCETAPGEIERDLFIGCNNELPCTETTNGPPTAP